MESGYGPRFHPSALPLQAKTLVLWKTGSHTNNGKNTLVDACAPQVSRCVDALARSPEPEPSSGSASSTVYCEEPMKDTMYDMDAWSSR